VGVLPSELLFFIMSYSAGSVAEFTAGAATARAFRAAAADLAADGNAAVWEHEFRSRDAILHRSFLSAALCHHADAPSSSSSSWRGRLRRLVELSLPGPTDLNSVPAASGLQLRTADFVLHRHPTHGFLLHLSEFRGTIVAYALRPPPSAAVGPGASSSSSSSASATKAKLGLFHCLPEMPDGHRPRAPATTLLLLRGVNDQPIHAFHSLAGVLACVQAAGKGNELCRWQLVECPARVFKELPKVYKLAALALAAIA
jgi:hypothetical protein